MAKSVRKLDVVVVSDFHLATHACKAKELLKYLKSILPKTLVLNGDIIDAWRFSRNYFPKSHMKVVRQLIKMMEKGTKIIYVTGNHDEFLREMGNMTLGNMKIVDQVTLELNDKKTFIFHGDIIDTVIHKAKWLAKIGAAAYGLITIINKAVNSILKCLRFDSIILYKKIKHLLGTDKTNKSKFEKKLARLACYKEVDTVICGHTHIPLDKQLKHENKSIRYINCGDWVENFTSVEYENGEWKLCNHAEAYNKTGTENKDAEDLEVEDIAIPSKRELYETLFRQLAFPN